MTHVGLVLGLVASLALAGCLPNGPNAQIDGWSIGEETPCAPNDARCLQMIRVATQRLDQLEPSHASVVNASVHAEGMYPDGDGKMGLIFRGGGFPTIVVFIMGDGSRRAFGVKYILADAVPTVFNYGPERRDGGGGGDAPAATV